VMVWARHIQKTVRERYGINLEPEPQFLGATF
jgi:UDP-N-acetylenolpyruvoylglucosamine reductase